MGDTLSLDPEFVAHLPPAFVTGMSFLLVIGVGAVAMARMRLRAQHQTGAASIASGFRATGIVALMLGLAMAAGAAVWLRPLGPWFHAIPGAIVADGLLFLREGSRRR